MPLRFLMEDEGLLRFHRFVKASPPSHRIDDAISSFYFKSEGPLLIDFIAEVKDDRSSKAAAAAAHYFL